MQFLCHVSHKNENNIFFLIKKPGLESSEKYFFTFDPIKIINCFPNIIYILNQWSFFRLAFDFPEPVTKF